MCGRLRVTGDDGGSTLTDVNDVNYVNSRVLKRHSGAHSGARNSSKHRGTRCPESTSPARKTVNAA